MADDLAGRRRGRAATETRRTAHGPTTRTEPPKWTTQFVIPRDACEACAHHFHHSCWGANILLDPIPDCPCDCGLPRDQSRLNPRAWADMAIHCPEQIWIAVQAESIRAGVGVFLCGETRREAHR